MHTYVCLYVWNGMEWSGVEWSGVTLSLLPLQLVSKFWGDNFFDGEAKKVGGGGRSGGDR